MFTMNFADIQTELLTILPVFYLKKIPTISSNILQLREFVSQFVNTPFDYYSIQSSIFAICLFHSG